MSGTKKASHADLIKKGLTWCVKNNAHAATKHKTFYHGLSMSYQCSNYCVKFTLQ